MTEIVQFLQRHGYTVVFFAVLAEQIGLPFPSALVLIAAGSLAGTGALNFTAALGLSIVASLAADFVWYLLGKLKGRSILKTLCRISLEPDSCVRQTEETFARHSVKSLLFSKFVPGLGTVAPPMAAVLHVGAGSFLFYDGLGATMWAGAYLLAGLVFRTEIEWLGEYSRSIGASVVEIAIVLVALYAGVRYYRRMRFYREVRMARISPVQLRALMESGAPTTIVDLRHSSEWEDGKIPGALLATLDELDKELAGISPAVEIVLYCS